MISSEIAEVIARSMDESRISTNTFSADESERSGPVQHSLAKQAGETVDRYRILRTLGQGGFGTVYLARDMDLDREVAVKVPRLDRFGSTEAIGLFVDEARKAAQLDHPGIVRIHDVQRKPDLVYIVQQYIGGGDLSKHLQSNRLPPRRIAELMIAIAEAVGYAHQQRYIHLDLKPANILLDTGGNPYVADFGLALHESTQSEMKGRAIGTYAYMSPAQVRGEVHRLDGRADIWSLGVILYEMLTGHRPLAGKTEKELIDQIQHHEPRPPRQSDPAIPAELSRICLVCLAKRESDRYPSTADLIDDLQHWLQTEAEVKHIAVDSAAIGFSKETDRESLPAKVIPQGLRSFEAEHADFYLQLLPGPHDREGLPKRVRFWKNQIEKIDADETFSVGLMYGPSGCGKTSLVKAALIPRLSDGVLPIYVEATATDTEVRLIKALKKRCPELAADVSLPEMIAQLRSSGGSRGRKVLIVLDQFEQWLHEHDSISDSQLIPALRQCDGGSVQCVVMVRDDFWMSATRFMQALEVPLVEGHNSAAVDLFDRDHATKVLIAFGQAYGKLPESPHDPSEQQLRFLEHVIDGLADEGRVNCVRLAVFAEMMKGRPWTEASLSEAGGTEGIGVTFLEETFSARTAPPSHRLHQEAVRAVLRALLPEQGTDIMGQMKAHGQLLEASGYGQRTGDFESLLGILDGEVRLITPTEPEESIEVDDRDAQSQHARYYQLTHDFLVPSIRQWLTQKQHETRRGRAELRLAERSALWNAKSENRHLPSLAEWVRIRTLTDKRKWTGPQRVMMSRAGRTHTLRWASVMSALLLIAFTVQRIVKSAQHRTLARQLETVVSSLNTSRGIILPPLAELEAYPRDMVIGELRSQFEGDVNPNKLPLAYALARYGDVQVDFLVSELEDAFPDEADNFVGVFRNAESESLQAMSLAADRCDRQPVDIADATDPSESDNGNYDHWRYKARLAMVSLQFGDASIAADMSQLRPNPVQRTLLIDEAPSWCDDLVQLSHVARSVDDSDLRSAICLVVGGLPEERRQRESDVAKGAWQAIFSEWHRNQPDNATHSASGWALRQWKLPVPELPVGEPERSDEFERQWQVSGAALTMLKIPAGKVQSELGETIEVAQDFLLSDREISVGLFQQFLDDPDHPETEKPQDRALSIVHAEQSPTPEHPVQEVSWIDAVLFCNWLSRREERVVCYKRVREPAGAALGGFGTQLHSGSSNTGDVHDLAWQLDDAADGYRLPTADQWEYACRAGTITRFNCGTDEKLLESYSVQSVKQVELERSRERKRAVRPCGCRAVTRRSAAAAAAERRRRC